LQSEKQRLTIHTRDLIARLTGYPNRPPQPEGYALEPFDESLLAAVRARGPIWRQVG
jgi:hypothetical protein